MYYLNMPNGSRTKGNNMDDITFGNNPPNIVTTSTRVDDLERRMTELEELVSNALDELEVQAGRREASVSDSDDEMGQDTLPGL